MATNPPDRNAVAPLSSTAILWTLGPLWYLLCEAITASAFPKYSYASNYISDLGVPEQGVLQNRVIDSPLHAVMNAGFIGEALLFLLGLVLLLPYLRRSKTVTGLLALGALHAVGIIIVGLVPGSEANSKNGLIIWHGLGAIAAIVCGNLVAIIAGHAVNASRTTSRVGQALGVLGILSGGLLFTHILFPDGVWERLSVYTFIAWQFIIGVTLLRARSSKSDTLAERILAS